MLSRNPALLKLLLLIGLSLLIGCSSTKPTVTDLGNRILRFVGLQPALEVFNAADSLASASREMTREEEYYLGRAVAAKILGRFKLSNDAAKTAYINQIGQALVAHSDQAETFGGFHFALLESTEKNAMAAPGGFIFITSGLFESVPDEDTLAGVLSHEIAHITEKHGIKAISNAKVNDALLALGKAAGSVNCGELLQQVTDVFGVAVDDIVSTVLEKGYGREQEYEADKGGLDLMTRTGYNPHAMVILLNLIARDANSSGGWTKSHPGAEERAEKVAELVAAREIKVDSESISKRSKRFESIVRS